VRRQGGDRLNEELRRLQSLLKLGYDLKAIWTPKQHSELDGEVRGNIIHIYSESLDEALMSLRHEFLDFAISETVQPYEEVTNALIALLNKQAYARKERLVEKLADLLSQSRS